MAVTADDVLSDFVSALRARDVEAALDLFDDDAVLYGSEADEQASGRDGIRDFLVRLFASPRTFGWAWSELVVDGQDGVLWFVAPAEVVVLGDDGSEQRQPYRLSGVLRRGTDKLWRMALFNGSEPAVRA